MSHLDHTPEFPETTDEWHAHTPDEGLPQEEHASTVNTPLLFLAFVGTVLSIVLVVVLTYLYFSAYMNQLRRTQIETTVLAEDYLRYRGEAREMQRDYAWVSVEGEDVILLPIHIATERIVQRYSQTGGGQEGGTQ